MTATSKPVPGSPAAVLDAVVRCVAEGRYRQARLHLLWNRDRVPADDMAELVTQASAAPSLPAGLTATDVIARTRPQNLPDWLDARLDNEIARICARQPVAGHTPPELVARVVAAVCIDVCVDTLDAVARAFSPEQAPAEPTSRNRLIHLSTPELINLGDELAESGPTIPPPPR